MSEENHPNFHAVKFVVEVMNAYKSSLRGLGVKVLTPKVNGMVAEFAEKIEEEVDRECGLTRL